MFSFHVLTYLRYILTDFRFNGQTKKSCFCRILDGRRHRSDGDRGRQTVRFVFLLRGDGNSGPWRRRRSCGGPWPSAPWSRCRHGADGSRKNRARRGADDLISPAGDEAVRHDGGSHAQSRAGSGIPHSTTAATRPAALSRRRRAPVLASAQSATAVRRECSGRPRRAGPPSRSR